MYILIDADGVEIAYSEDGIRYHDNRAIVGYMKPVVYNEYNEENSSIITRDYFNLNSLKETTRVRLKEERDYIIDQPISNVQVARSEDRENIQGTITYFDSLIEEGATTLDWTMADNTTQALSKEDLQTITTSYMLRKASAYKVFQEVTAVLDESTDPDEIESLTIELTE